MDRLKTIDKIIRRYARDYIFFDGNELKQFEIDSEVGMFLELTTTDGEYESFAGLYRGLKERDLGYDKTVGG